MFKFRTAISASLFLMLLVFSCAKNSVYAKESNWYDGLSIGEASILEDVYDDSTPTSFFIGKRYDKTTSFEFGYLDLGGFESAPGDPDYDASADIPGIVVSALRSAKLGLYINF